MSDLSGTNVTKPTNLAFGPDGRLYITNLDGQIYIYEVRRNGVDDYEVVPGTEEVIDLIKDIPNHDDDGTLNTAPANQKRQVTGMVLAGTAANPIMYVGSSDPRIGGASKGDKNLDTNSGTISRLTWNGSSWEKVDLIRGLPRSEENHANNGMAIKDDTLFVSIGSNTNLGAPSDYFAWLGETYYTTGIFFMELSIIDTFSNKVDIYGNTYKYNLPTVDDPDRVNISAVDGFTDTNDPFGGNNGLNQAKYDPAGPLKIYTRGVRNGYDLLITSQGYLFTIDNGANPGYGDNPENEGPPVGGVSNITNNYTGAEPDDANNKNGLYFIPGYNHYFGHPNPIRANPSGAGWWDGVNNTFRTDTSVAFPLPADWPPLPVGMADPREGELILPFDENQALAWYFISTNGLTEYTASNHGGIYQGDILGASFNKKIYRTDLDASGKALDAGGNSTFFDTGINGSKPLDIIALPDGGYYPGTVWMADYNQDVIRILEPTDFCQNTDAEAAFVVDPSGTGNIDVSTDGAGSFQITNNSGSGQQIEMVTIDLSTAIFPDMVFDPNGTAGDDFAKVLTADGGSVATGFFASNLTGAHDNGFDKLELSFSNFDPGETFTFSIDVDPTSIQGETAPGTNNAGYVSGMELTGAQIIVFYNGCSLDTSRIFPISGDVEGAENCIKDPLPTAGSPTLEIVGLTGPDLVVFSTSQTARVTGSDGDSVRLFVMEGGLYVNGAGFDIDAFEANKLVNVTEYNGKIGVSGYIDIPITLTKADNDAGINHVVAVIHDSGCTSDLSEVWRLKYETPTTPVDYRIAINAGSLSTPDAQLFPYLAFNLADTFSVGNAVLTAEPGQTINLTVVNNDTADHNFQVQGATVSAAAIAPGDSATYSFSFPQEGEFIFYDNLSGQNDSYMGLAGLIDVQNFSGKRFYWNIREQQSLWNFLIASGGSVNYPDYEPDYFTVNGKSYPDLQLDSTAIIKTSVDSTIRLVIANTGLMKHSMHFHGYHLTVIYSSKYPSHVGRIKDTFPIDQYETLILELTPSKPGTYPVHDHNLIAVTGAGEYPNGMIGFITISN
ncbi:MAG: multicopper oxidase domain-containing protein [Bacteroidetes bacterium]|nr:multicopper oxidase domain-containing protein [Bacteroidota bacterium]MCB0842690.1 multicopper oxidase domain-containing protein [Bacteroidota bacterium]